MEREGRHRLNIFVNAMFIAYGAIVAAVWWRFFRLPGQGDEYASFDWLSEWHRDGFIAALRGGLPLVYLSLVRLAGGDRAFLAAGRAISAIGLILLGLSVWWIARRLGVSRLPRRLAILTFLAVVLAGRNFVFMAIADVTFTLVMLWVLVGIERAVVQRRPGLAVAAGIGWAGTWAIRPLAALYTLAILGGISALILRDVERSRAARLGLVVALIAGTGVLLQQLPSLLADGRLTVESKGGQAGDDARAQLRHLALLRHGERGWLADLLRVPLADGTEVYLYLTQHGEDSLARTTAELWRRTWRQKLSEVPVDLAIRMNFYLGALLGAFYPLAWYARASPGSGATEGRRLAFFAVVMLVYIIVLDVIVSPFIEWRWLLLPCVVFVCGGALALERLRATRPGVAAAIAGVQIAFLCVSLIVWTGRVLREVYPAADVPTAAR